MQLLNELKAEVVLKDTAILGQITNLKTSLTYKTDSNSYQFEDYFNILNKEIKGIDRIELMAAIPPGGAQSYLVELSTALQQVTDKIEVAQMKAIYFQGKLKSALHLSNNLLATFSAWYQIAISEKLKEAGVKIPASTQKALAESEFSRLIGDTDLNIDGLLSAVEVMVVHLKEMRKIAQEKYKLGTDQANASIVNLPFNGVGSAGDNSFPLLKKHWSFTEDSEPVESPDNGFDDLDEDPAYVERRRADQVEVPEGIHKIIESSSPAVIVAEEVSEEDLGKFITINGITAEELTDLVKDREAFMAAYQGDFTPLPPVEAEEIVMQEPDSFVAESHAPAETTTLHDDFAGDILVKAGKATLVPLSKKKITFDDDDDAEIPVVVKEEVKVEKTETKPKKKVVTFDDDEEEEIPFQTIVVKFKVQKTSII